LKSQDRFKRRLTAALAVGAGLMLAVSGCAGGSPAPTDAPTSDAGGGEPLLFGVMASYTASGSNSGPAIEAGFRARFDQLNASGGIQGHPIEVVTADDALDPAKAPAAARTLVEDKGVLATTTSGSGTAVAVQPYLEQQGVLAFTGGAATPLIESPTSTFRLDKATYYELGGRITQFAIDELGIDKIGIAFTPDAVGEPTRDGALAVLDAAGLEPTAVVEYTTGATDASAQAAQLKESGAEFVVINHIPSVEGLIINAAEKIDYHPIYGGTFAAANTSMIDLFGDILDGRHYFATSWALPFSDDAADFREWLEKGGSGVDPGDGDAMNGWTQAESVVAVYTKAVEIAGGAVPTREQVIQAASDIEIDSPYVLGISWTPTDFTGPNKARVTVLKDGEFQEADPPKEVPVKTVLPG